MITFVPIEKIVSTPNPVSEQDHKPIVESIERIGLQYPILVEKNDNGYYHIVDGRTRFKALQHLKWKEIPCIPVNGNSAVIGIDVEICRRHLDKKAQENLQKKVRDIVYKEATSKIQSLRGILPKESVTKLENLLEQNFWAAEREIKKIYSILNEIDLKDIEGYIVSDSRIHRDKEILQEQCLKMEKELQEKTKKLEQIEKEKRELKTNYEEMKKTFKNNLDTLVEKRLQSVLSTMESEDTDKYEELKEKIREEIEEEYKSEKDDLAQKIKEQSSAIQKLLNEKKSLGEALEENQRKIKDIQMHIDKMQDEYKMKEEIIRKAISPDGVFKRIGRIYEDMGEIDKEILSLIDYTSLLSETNLKLPGADIAKAIENMEKIFSQVNKTLNEFKKTIKNLTK